MELYITDVTISIIRLFGIYPKLANIANCKLLAENIENSHVILKAIQDFFYRDIVANDPVILRIVNEMKQNSGMTELVESKTAENITTGAISISQKWNRPSPVSAYSAGMYKAVSALNLTPEKNNSEVTKCSCVLL